MQVKDVMQTNVAAVGPEDEVSVAAKIMAARRVSGLPVIDSNRAVIGMLTEGDFLARAELGRKTSRSWWLDLIGADAATGEFVRSHAKFVKDAMTKDVHTIAPDVSLAAAAAMLESKGVKRLPVVSNGQLVGIVSRADLVRAFASLAPETQITTQSDSDIREAVQQTIAGEEHLSGVQVTVLAHNGVIELWGLATSQAEIDAVRVVAEQIPGVRSVKLHITQFPAAYYA